MGITNLIKSIWYTQVLNEIYAVVEVSNIIHSKINEDASGKPVVANGGRIFVSIKLEFRDIVSLINTCKTVNEVNTNTEVLSDIQESLRKTVIESSLSEQEKEDSSINELIHDLIKDDLNTGDYTFPTATYYNGVFNYYNEKDKKWYNLPIHLNRLELNELKFLYEETDSILITISSEQVDHYNSLYESTERKISNMIKLQELESITYIPNNPINRPKMSDSSLLFIDKLKKQSEVIDQFYSLTEYNSDPEQVKLEVIKSIHQMTNSNLNPSIRFMANTIETFKISNSNKRFDCLEITVDQLISMINYYGDDIHFEQVYSEVELFDYMPMRGWSLDTRDLVKREKTLKEVKAIGTSISASSISNDIALVDTKFNTVKIEGFLLSDFDLIKLAHKYNINNVYKLTGELSILCKVFLEQPISPELQKGFLWVRLESYEELINYLKTCVNSRESDYNSIKAVVTVMSNIPFVIPSTEKEEEEFTRAHRKNLLSVNSILLK